MKQIHSAANKKVSVFQTIYAHVKQIPRGRVATYGQIAALFGSPRTAQMVGWALHQLPESELPQVPWHRVINREGRISTTCLEHTAAEQANRLLNESVEVTRKHGNYCIDLKKYLWVFHHT
jgi:methylated-DNA-protein-cysteine methyltransferase-like protein